MSYIKNHTEFYKDFISRRKTIVYFLTDKNKPRRGVIVGFKDDDGKVKIGYSILDLIDEEKHNFNDVKHLGFRKAVANAVEPAEIEDRLWRANTQPNHKPGIVYIQDVLDQVITQTNKYFGTH